MKKTCCLFFISLFVGAMVAVTGPALAASSIVVAQDVPPRMMNPHGDDSDAGLQYMANFFDGLLQRKGSEGTLMPALATKWEHPDLRSWKFYLRKGVKFHNGNPFTAQDVKFSFERLRNPEVSEFLNTGKTIDADSMPAFLLLAFAFAAMAFDHGALIAHLLPLFSERGVHGEVAVLAAAMIGPMQVTGRLAMIAFETKIATISVAAASVLAMAIASVALFGVKYEPMLLVVFVLFQGAGFGVASIVRPLLIAELLGRRKFGTIAGLLAVPFLVALALAPSIAGYIWTFGGYDALIIITVCVSVSGVCALMLAARTATRIWDGTET